MGDLGDGVREGFLKEVPLSQTLKSMCEFVGKQEVLASPSVVGQRVC